MSALDLAGFHFLSENSNDVICRTGLDLVLSYASPSSLPLLGWKPEEMIGKRLDIFVPAAGGCALGLEARDALSAGPENLPATVSIGKKDGSIVWLEIKQRLLLDPATGRPGETVFVMHDVTERKALEERLSALMSTDFLTGLCTRGAFDDALEREWSRAVRETSRLSLLLLDLDHFKYLHTWQGHIQGDGCLEKTATAVLGALRATDIAAHYAAEDIAVILPATGSSGAARAAGKITSALQALRAPHSVHRQSDVPIDVSIGIATAFARSGASERMPALLLLAAGVALSRAKAAKLKC